MPGEVKIEIRIDEETKHHFKVLCEILGESMTNKLLGYIEHEIEVNWDEIEKHLKKNVNK